MAVAQRLQSCLRSGDTAARLGGDEFAVLVEDVIVPTDATRVAERILDVLRASFMIQGKEVIVRASIGIAISNTGLEEADDLLRNADVSMYVAKSNGKGNYVVFQPRMHAEVLAQLELESDLHRAFSREEFTIYYQPTVDLRSERIVGMEALLRWKHPQRGLVHPEEFISTTEETGLILTLGRWVLRCSCHQARAWQLQHPMQPPLMLNVNVSASQLKHPDFVSDVAQVLEESGLDPQSLILEITESVLMNDAEVTMGTIRGLKELGVRLAIDDFGTGYSSLGYIRRFEIDILKIDKSFLKSIGTRAEEPSLAQAVIQLGRSLGLQTIAEGIETAEQLELLQVMDCDLGQGYLFAGPLDPDSMDALLSKASMDQEWFIPYLPRRGLGLLWDGVYTPSEKLAS
jgi:predicted signal transduction protein with EAL and GGDEF domain